MPPEDKDAALFPHRIGDYWAMIHRPVGYNGAHMWMSYSPDLRHWGSHKLMLEARRVRGGMRIKSASRPRPSKPRRVGW